MDKAGEVLNKLLDTISRRNQYNIPEGSVSFFNSWESIAGENLAAHSKVKDVEGHTAVIEVDHPGWSQTMQLYKRKILKKIQKCFPALEIEEIRIQLADKRSEPGSKQKTSTDAKASELKDSKAEADKAKKNRKKAEPEASHNKQPDSGDELPGDELSGIEDAELKNKLAKLYQGIKETEDRNK